jgi:hypothetical protein
MVVWRELTLKPFTYSLFCVWLINYISTYILEGVFFDRHTIDIKSMIAILWLINKRPQTPAVLTTHELLCNQVTINQGVCSADNIDCPGY